MHCALQEQSREPTWLNETAGRVRIVFLSPAVFELGQAPTLAPVDFATRFFEHSMKPRTGHWWYSLQECSFRLDRQSGQAVLQRVTRAAQRQCLEGCQRSANQPEELLPVDEEVRFGAQAKDTRKLTECYREVTGSGPALPPGNTKLRPKTSGPGFFFLILKTLHFPDQMASRLQYSVADAFAATCERGSEILTGIRDFGCAGRWGESFVRAASSTERGRIPVCRQ